MEDDLDDEADEATSIDVLFAVAESSCDAVAVVRSWDSASGSLLSASGMG